MGRCLKIIVANALDRLATRQCMQWLCFLAYVSKDSLCPQFTTAATTIVQITPMPNRVRQACSVGQSLALSKYGMLTLRRAGVEDLEILQLIYQASTWANLGRHLGGPRLGLYFCFLATKSTSFSNISGVVQKNAKW